MGSGGLSYWNRLALCTLGVFALTGCQPSARTLDPLAPMFQVQNDNAQVAVNFCTTPSAPMQSNLKYIFILDNSKSNAVNYQFNYSTDFAGNVTAQPLCPLNLTPPVGTGLLTYATDPTRERRYKALLDYVTAIESDPARSADMTRYYSLVEFSTIPVVQGGFTNDVTQFKNVVNNRFLNGIDNGATNYLAALATVRDMIQADITSERAKAQPKVSAYVLIYISDGMPLPGGLACNGTTPVYFDENGQSITGPQPTNQVLQLVQSITAFEGDQDLVESVTLFTGYMGVKGNEDPGAKSLLAQMAKMGHGVSYDFTSGDQIDYSLFSLPPRMQRYELGEIFVSNASAVWWPGESEPLLDSDGDGLPDKFDVLPKFDPFRKSAAGNGISDFAKYRYPNGATPPSAIGAGDTDKDGISDREEYYLGNSAGIGNFDTNGNMIPDALEFLNFVDFKSKAGGLDADSDMDGLSNLYEIKHGLPPMINNSQFIGLIPTMYELTQVSSSNSQDCYHLAITNLKRISPDDLIRVLLVEKSPVIFNQYRLRAVEKRFTPGVSRLEIGL